MEFRAGLMALTDGRLAADPRKGILRVNQVLLQLQLRLADCLDGAVTPLHGWRPHRTSGRDLAAHTSGRRSARHPATPRALRRLPTAARPPLPCCRTRRGLPTCAGMSAMRPGRQPGSQRRTLSLSRARAILPRQVCGVCYVARPRCLPGDLVDSSFHRRRRCILLFLRVCPHLRLPQLAPTASGKTTRSSLHCRSRALAPASLSSSLQRRSTATCSSGEPSLAYFYLCRACHLAF